MQKVIFPESVKWIEGYTFDGCPALKNVWITAEDAYIGMLAFASCENLENIYLLYSAEEVVAITLRII